MTRTAYDQAAKVLLESALADAGHAEIQREVVGEPQWADVFFQPAAGRPPPLTTSVYWPNSWPDKHFPQLRR